MTSNNITREITVANVHADLDQVHISLSESHLTPAEARQLAERLNAAADEAEKAEEAGIPDVFAKIIGDPSTLLERILSGKLDEPGR